MSEDILYELFKDVVEDFSSLVIYRVDSPSDYRYPRVWYLQNIIQEKIKNTTNTKEKRVLKSLVHYLFALRGYYNYWEIYENYSERLKTRKLLDNKKQIREQLNSALLSLKDGKNILDKNEDVASIDFLNKSINTVSDVLNEINWREREEQKKEEENLREIRKRNGLCIICGSQLGFIDKLVGRTDCNKHRNK